MRPKVFAVASVGVVVAGVMAMSAAGGSSSTKTLANRPSNTRLVTAARASALHLFSTFPSALGRKRKCVFAPGWGAPQHTKGSCATSITFVHTPAFLEAKVSFQEVWPRGEQSWTIIERWISAGSKKKKIQVLNTLWHGDIAGRLDK
jgi:hypothetical protein